jgi:hexosaminidase
MDNAFRKIIRCFDKDWPYTLAGAYKINGGPQTGVLDPSYPETYELLNGIFTDFNSAFPDDYVHLGGDEVFTSCFNENPNIINFMNDNGISTYSDLISWHISKTRDVLSSVNSDKTAVYWSNEDTFYMNYKAGDVLMYWGESANIKTFKATYPDNYYVMAPGDIYYIDCGMGNKYGGNSWCDPFKTWWTIY